MYHFILQKTKGNCQAKFHKEPKKNGCSKKLYKDYFVIFREIEKIPVLRRKNPHLPLPLPGWVFIWKRSDNLKNYFNFFQKNDCYFSKVVLSLKKHFII
jgi:hypothetical protein